MPETEKVRAVVLEQPERMVMRTFDLPAVSEDDALLKVEMAGICHTDVGLYHGTVRYALPLIMGHEIVGRIAKIGLVAARRWAVREGLLQPADQPRRAAHQDFPQAATAHGIAGGHRRHRSVDLRGHPPSTLVDHR